MKRVIVAAMLFGVSVCAVFSQTKNITVTGRIIEAETNEPAIQANVQLLQLPDSSYQAGIASEMNGRFTLPKVAAGNYVLKVSYIGFKNKFVPLKLASSAPRKDVGTIKLETDAILLSEAVVTAEVAAVQTKEDTVVFNAAAYKTTDGAMLEELVKKLPGAEVDEDGNVKINGKDLSKIMVNGKEFFGGDVQTGLQNLPVEMIDKLKTYEKKSDMTRITGIDDGEEETVLDLTVKEGMNQGFFGNVDLGMGTKSRYAEHATLNYFRDETRVSVIGSANNIRRRRWGSNNGLEAEKEIGVDFARETAKLDMGGSVRYEYEDEDRAQTGYNENFLPNGNSFSNSNSANRNKNRNVWTEFRFEWKPDTMTNIMFRPSFSYSNNRGRSHSSSGTFDKDPYDYVENPNDYLDEEAVTNPNDPLHAIRVNAMNNGSRSKNRNVSFNGDLMLNRKLNNRGRNITLRSRFGYGDSENDNFSVSRNDLFRIQNHLGGDSILNRNQYVTTPSNNYNVGAELMYSEPIAKAVFLQLTYGFSYRYTESDKRTYDMYAIDPGWEIDDPLPGNYLNHAVDSLGKYAEYKYYTHDARVALRFIREKWQLNVGVSVRPQHTVLSYKKGDYMIDTVRNVTNFTPNIDFRYNIDKQTNIRFNYWGRSSEPGMENLLPIVDNSNPLNVRVGNPGLKPSFSHEAWGEFHNYNAEHQRNIFTMIRFRATQNSVSNSRIYDDQTGGWTTTPKNINGNWNVHGGFNFSTALKNKKFNVSSDTWFNHNNSVNYQTDNSTKEEQKNKATTTGLTERVRGFFRNDVVEIGLSGSINYSIERDKLNPDNDQEPYTYTYGGNAMVYLPWGMNVSTDIETQNRRGYRSADMNKNELVWNAQLSQSFFKGALTLSVDWYDILRKKTNISRWMNADGRSVYVNNGINSYCMFRAIYRLNIFGGKNARQGGGEHREGFGHGRRRGPGGFGGGRRF